MATPMKFTEETEMYIEKHVLVEKKLFMNELNIGLALWDWEGKMEWKSLTPW